MATALVTHAACIEHAPPDGHPERPARLVAVLDALAADEFGALVRKEPPLATEESLARVHDRDYIRDVLDSIPNSGFVQFDGDTIGSPGTGEAILRAAGAVNFAVDLVMAGEAKNAFCAVRPPGHHAVPDRAMGFCLFNNVAVGAEHARAVHGLKRVAVVDFDVHHGNGTQDMFYAKPDLFFASTHQSPLYPGTGRSSEHGVANNIVNVPLSPGSGGAEFRRALDEIVLPALRKFEPELIFISAGFDAHRDDPLANLRLDESDFGWATESICRVADEVCAGRVVSTLEGGYDLDALARSARAHVLALMAA